jgi:HEAT repeat protein
MVVFLQTAHDRDRSRIPVKPDDEGILTCLQAFDYTDAKHQEIKEIPGAVQALEAYQKLTRRDEQTAFLLGQLEHPNTYLKPFVRREVLLKSIREAIPYFRRQLELPSERERLDAASMLRVLGDKEIEQQLLQWLNDPHWTAKGELINEIAKTRSTAAIPPIRKFVNSEDSLVAVTARSALLQLGDPEGRTLLFDFLNNSSNPRLHRYNAIHELHWNYHGGFTNQEVELLKKLQQDKDESISRVAGFIISELPQPK